MRTNPMEVRKLELEARPIDGAGSKCDETADRLELEIEFADGTEIQARARK